MTRIVYTFHSKVVKVEEMFRPEYVSGTGDKTVFNQVSLGWFVFYEGSWEGLFFGMEKPALEVGDRVKISQEKL